MTRGQVGVLVFAAVVVGAVLHRLPYGVDFADEAYFVEMTHRFAHGARPFVDELSPQQFQAFLFSPLVWVYEAIRGQDGLVLYLRYVYFACAAGTAGCVYWGASGYVSRQFAVLLALACVAYVPFNIPTPSYSSIAFLALTAGCFLGVVRDSRIAVLAAGVCHAVAVSVYPTLAVLPLAMAAVRLRERQALWQYLTGVGVGLLPAIGVDLWVGSAQLSKVASLGFHAGYGHLATLSDAVEHLGKILGFAGDWARHTSPLLWGYGLVVLAAARWRPTLAQYALCLLPAAVDASLPPDAFTSTPLVVYWALLLPFCLSLLREHTEARTLFRTIGIPSLLCGAVMAFTSYNGLDKAALGLFPACLLTSMALSWYIDRGALGLVPHALLVLLFVILLYGPPYNDQPMAALTTRVQTAGFAGLITSPQRNSFLSQLAADVDRLGPTDGTVMFYNDFPAGYLLTRLRCDAAMCWISQYYDRDSLLGYYEGHRPDVVVRMKRVPRTLTGPDFVIYRDGDRIDDWIKSSAYRPALSSGDYDVYVSNPTGR